MDSRELTLSAIIAAIYAVMTIVLAPISFLAVQVRVSDAMMTLPARFGKAAVYGLTIGCIIANLFSPLGMIDILVGGVANLTAAWLTMKIQKWYLSWVPPTIIISVLVGIELSWLFGLPLLLTIGQVAIGSLIACLGIGVPLLLSIQRVIDDSWFPSEESRIQDFAH